MKYSLYCVCLFWCILTVYAATELSRPADVTVDETGDLKRRYAPAYQYYAQPFYARPYYAQPYYAQQPAYANNPVQPYQRRPPHGGYRYYYPQPNNGGSLSHGCIAGNAALKLESVAGSVQSTQRGFQQTFARLRSRHMSPFQLPGMLFEMAKSVTSMIQELVETVVSVHNCASQSNNACSQTGNSGDDSVETNMKERFVSSLENLKQSAKSLESALGELLKSPFKAFNNIDKIFSDLEDGLKSAIEALTGKDHDDDCGNTDDTGNGSSSDTGGGGFADFTSYAAPDTESATATATDTNGFGVFDSDSSGASSTGNGGFGAFAPSNTALVASSTTISSDSGPYAEWTRVFTFTAEDYFTFTNEEVMTMNQMTVTREFEFTTVDLYRFTDTSIIEVAATDLPETDEPTASITSPMQLMEKGSPAAGKTRRYTRPSLIAKATGHLTANMNSNR